MSDDVTVDTKELDGLFKRITSFPRNYSQALDTYNQQSTLRLLELVKQHASGRPGPNVVTGTYLAAFRIEGNRVVNPSPQTHRLEYGYFGTDSAGRVYAQPPFPHFRPALEEMRLEYKPGIVRLVRQVWNQS